MGFEQRRPPQERANRLWRIGDIEFDEARRELRVGGVLREVEAKPLLVFAELLLLGGEIVTGEDLLKAVWPGSTVPQSLTTAISKLRTALGERGRDIVESVPRAGYRLGVAAELLTPREKPRLASALRAGNAVPNRPQWSLARSLGGAGDVWLARHEKTGEERVFKFADTEERRMALRREVALSRILYERLGVRPDLARLSEWSLDARPFYVESHYGGPNLSEWAEAQGGLATLALDLCVTLAARIARTVAAAHGVGVLHRDIKPTNILVAGEGADLTLRLVDFGSGRLTEAARIAAVTVTGLGLTATGAPDGERLSGTLRYMAPEVIEGAPPTTAADVYSLGILLYQLVAGDLDRTITTGWEDDIADPLLRQDIRQATARDPVLRIQSASVLGERLETLDERRREQDRLHLVETQAKQLGAQVERARARKPWLILAITSLVLGLVATSASAIHASRVRDEAQRQAYIAKQVDVFLTDDLLDAANPSNSGKADETLLEAAEKAEPRIAYRLATEPLVAASIYRSLAQAFAGRTAFAEARKAFRAALEAFARAEGPGSPDATILLLQEAYMEITSAEGGAMERASALIAEAKRGFGRLGERSAEGRVWLWSAEATVQLLDGDVKIAESQYRAAADLAETIPEVFSPNARFNFRQRQAYSELRLGKFDEAEALIRRLIGQQMVLNGPHHPNTLMAQLTLATIQANNNQAETAIKTISAIQDDLVKVYGADHRLTLQAFATRAQAEGVTERYDDAIRDDRTVYKASVAKSGPHAVYSFGTLADIGQWECRSSHIEAGLADSKSALAEANATLGPKHAVTQGAGLIVAFCEVVAEQYADASALIDKADATAVGQLVADPNQQAWIDLMRAWITHGLGDDNRARSLLSKQLQIYSRPDADRYAAKWSAALAQSLSVDPASTSIPGASQP